MPRARRRRRAEPWWRELIAPDAPDPAKRLISSFMAFCDALGGTPEISPLGLRAGSVALRCHLSKEADTMIVRKHGSELSVSLALGGRSFTGALAPVTEDEVRVEVHTPGGELLSVQKGAGAGSYVRFRAPSGRVSVRKIALDHLPGSRTKLSVWMEEA